MPVSDNIRDNLDTTYREIAKAVRSEAQIIILPEMFGYPYENSAFTCFAQPRGAQIWQSLNDFAQEFRIAIVSGSFLELDGGISAIPASCLILSVKR